MTSPFSLFFITAHQAAFDEFLSLGTTAAQKSAEGEQATQEYEKAFKMQQILKARRNSELTDKEAEALDGCLTYFTFSQYLPTNQSVIPPLLNQETYFQLYEDGTMLYEDGFKMTYQ